MTTLTEPQSREIAYLDQLAATAWHHEVASFSAVFATLIGSAILKWMDGPIQVRVIVSIFQVVAVTWWLITHDRAKDAKWRADAHLLAAVNYRFGYRDGSAAKLDESHPCK